MNMPTRVKKINPPNAATVMRVKPIAKSANWFTTGNGYRGFSIKIGFSIFYILFGSKASPKNPTPSKTMKE